MENSASRTTPRVSIETSNLRLPFREAVVAAGELGVDGIIVDARRELRPAELSATGLRQVRKILEDRCLRVAAVVFRTRRGYAVMEDLDRRVAATQAAMEMAYQLGAPIVLNAIGRIPAKEDVPATRVLLDVLDNLGRFGNRVGAVLAAETGSESGEELARLLAQLPDGAVGVDLNPAKLLVNGFSPLDAVAALGPRIVHVHVNDIRRGLTADRAEPTRIGRGDVDLPAILAALDEHGYRGYFTVESAGPGEPKHELADAISRLRQWV